MSSEWKNSKEHGSAIDDLTKQSNKKQELWLHARGLNVNTALKTLYNFTFGVMIWYSRFCLFFALKNTYYDIIISIISYNLHSAAINPL